MNISQLLHRTALAHGERSAVFLGAQPVCDYHTLAGRVARLAAHLRARCGVQPGDRVAIFSANCTQYLEALHAIHWAGAISVPVNYKLHSKELAYVLENSGARAVCVSPELRDSALDAGASPNALLVFGDTDWQAAVSDASPLVMEDRRPDDVASLFYTSGTTGRPKGVMQTHRNLLATTMAYFTDVDDVQAHDAMVYAAPMSHGAGLYNYAHMLRGARHVVPVSGGFDPAELVELAASVGHLSLFAAPTMVHRLVEHVRRVEADVEAFKTIVYGGGPMYVEDLRDALDTMGQKFVQIYGQGECPMTITALAREQIAETGHPRWAERIASVGKAHACVEVRVVDANDCEVPVGELGEVAVRGDAVMAGYWANESSTQSTLRGGWLHTGDVASMDADGFLTLRDRSKDVIISGGSNIYPREVEEVLLMHPQISEVAVVGQRDADWGEVVIAFLVAADGARPEDAELDALCLDHIARFKRPKAYRFVPALPKNSYGKVLKTELRDWLAKAD
ncbi:AMP-binding protein [Diaphorobacter caeni]|uniref:AMP-binding protein n=1 Tax=Diaphorobacter caeni TaxID=2784387 RepID=UPI00188F0238|nr:AMP-binding protein [Diaphorobacter caeni]MBF5003936.1 AMP-binding protein [Diaphorobacter caeni]